MPGRARIESRIAARLMVMLRKHILRLFLLIRRHRHRNLGHNVMNHPRNRHLAQPAFWAEDEAVAEDGQALPLREREAFVLWLSHDCP